MPIIPPLECYGERAHVGPGTRCLRSMPRVSLWGLIILTCIETHVA